MSEQEEAIDHHEERAEAFDMDYAEYTKWRAPRVIELVINAVIIVATAVPVAMVTGSVYIGAAAGAALLTVQQELLWRFYYKVPEMAPSRRVRDAF